METQKFIELGRIDNGNTMTKEKFLELTSGNELSVRGTFGLTFDEVPETMEDWNEKLDEFFNAFLNGGEFAGVLCDIGYEFSGFNPQTKQVIVEFVADPAEIVFDE